MKQLRESYLGIKKIILALKYKKIISPEKVFFKLCIIELKI